VVGETTDEDAVSGAIWCLLATGAVALGTCGGDGAEPAGCWTTAWRWLACAYLGVGLYTVPAFLPTS
jgi:hypothetical protein